MGVGWRRETGQGPCSEGSYTLTEERETNEHFSRLGEINFKTEVPALTFYKFG
jgi:hypothetical protein